MSIAGDIRQLAILADVENVPQHERPELLLTWEEWNEICCDPRMLLSPRSGNRATGFLYGWPIRREITEWDNPTEWEVKFE